MEPHREHEHDVRMLAIHMANAEPGHGGIEPMEDETRRFVKGSFVGLLLSALIWAGLLWVALVAFS